MKIPKTIADACGIYNKPAQVIPSGIDGFVLISPSTCRHFEYIHKEYRLLIDKLDKAGIDIDKL